jgi:hypothetical protein
MDDIPEFQPIYLCAEGERLFQDWIRYKWNYDWLPINDDRPEATRKANAAWTEYQDHRVKCGECTKARIR